MRNMIAYCGLDCEKRDAYLATINDDQEFFCDIRQCALKKGVATCGDCPDIEHCQTVATIIATNP